MPDNAAADAAPSTIRRACEVAQPSSHSWDERAFRRAYAQRIEQGCFLEEPGYYPRYRARYRETLKYIWSMPLPAPAHITDVGGGHFAVLLQELRGDRVSVLDVSDKHAAYLKSLGVEHHTCDLVHDAVPPLGSDLIIVAEVVEHLSTPPYLALHKLATALRPGGYMLITTPNLFRLRNVVRMLQGRDYTARFQYPARGVPMGHVMEYSRAHLIWQVEQANLDVLRADLRQPHHHPGAIGDRLLYWLGYPLFLRPMWRDQLILVARRPVDAR